MLTSAAFLADISVKSSRKLFIFIISKKKNQDQRMQKTVYLFLKTEALMLTVFSGDLHKENVPAVSRSHVCKAMR